MGEMVGRKACVMPALEARQLQIRGRVQGIGFRPELFRRAKDFAVTGWVQNDSDGVLVHIEGGAASVQGFVEGLRDNPPPLAFYTHFAEKQVEAEGIAQFFIKESMQTGSGLTDVSPDLALCEACQADLREEGNRRHHYPFTTCTYCGPRYTFIEKMPYDRPFTTMANFPLCPDCQTEYHDPFDRRFHAQPIACPTCGPKLRLYQREEGSDLRLVPGDPIEQVRRALRSGAVVAIKGLGGYHLAVAADLDHAVEQLRLRKKRPDKPLALMIRDLDTIRDYCELNEQEEALLPSNQAPIVLLQKKQSAPYLANGIAPNSTRLGVMLPYTPLHHLLLNEELPVVVMTSANLSGQPLVADEAEWFRPDHIANWIDYLMTDNRPIANPLDDSVVEVAAVDLKPVILRRARGYVPESVPLHLNVEGILALGAEQHAAFALGRNNRVYQGPYTGTLSTLEIQERYLGALDRYQTWFGDSFTHIVCDMHPGYWSTQYAQTLANERGIALIPVQHHHAHMAAVMVEHGLTEDCFGIVLDGTGYGTDGTIWGMEIIHGNYSSFQRVAALEPIPLIGGEAAIRETWRIAYALLSRGGKEKEAKDYLASMGQAHHSGLLSHMMNRQINTPEVSSCGRLFDGISALLGICPSPSYDSQAAIELTEAANSIREIQLASNMSFSYTTKQLTEVLSEVHPQWQMNWQPMMHDIYSARLNARPVSEISMRFHYTIANMLCDTLVRAIEANKHSALKKTTDVVLAGGSMQNRLLLTLLTQQLTNLGFRVYRPEQFSSGDGGISVGQLAVAAAKRIGR
ncbi:carbamoyltransferase HypF [Brevibacillus ginsengisoli]|uniref:carbamoyltransferase HypF n=1 Tax=Brevibacillus ginsengisoli TaxID=363854 RepID=UPI003CF4949B